MDVEPSTYLTDAEKGKLKDAASNVFRAECQRELAFWEAVVAFDKDGKVLVVVLLQCQEYRLSRRQHGVPVCVSKTKQAAG